MISHSPVLGEDVIILVFLNFVFPLGESADHWNAEQSLRLKASCHLRLYTHRYLCSIWYRQTAIQIPFRSFSKSMKKNVWLIIRYTFPQLYTHLDQIWHYGSVIPLGGFRHMRMKALSNAFLNAREASVLAY
jgi:hypothetical protein